MREPVRAVLARAVFDDEFRQRLRAEPARALDDYDLTAEERELLQSETGVLQLMHVPMATESLPELPPLPALPESNVVPMAELGFAIRVTPYAVQHADGRLEVRADAVAEPAQLPPPQQPAPAAPLYGHQPRSEAAVLAAEKVRSARPEDQSEAVLDLIQAIRGSADDR